MTTKAILVKFALYSRIVSSMILRTLKKSVEPFESRVWLKFHPYSQEYFIEGSKNLNRNPDYQNRQIEPQFQLKMHNFKNELIELQKSGNSRSFYKFGDGDYYFLKGIHLGSAKPGNRAISRELTSSELNVYRLHSKNADKYMCEIPLANRKFFDSVFPEKDISYPAELVYGLTANKWLTQTFSSDIGLIGADVKLELIETLMSFPEYQNYLGLESFAHYVTIPQKFACDDLEDRYESVKKQILNSQCRFYLVGIGHLKSGILGRISRETGSVLLDIGSGIDALAGLIDSQRPYFGSWMNYRSYHHFDYSRVDFLQYKKSDIREL